MRPIGGYHHRHMHAGSMCRRARRVVKRGKRSLRAATRDLHVGTIERAHDVEHGPRCGCDTAEELENERSLWPDEFVGLDDDEHPRPFASAMWLAFLRLPRC